MSNENNEPLLSAEETNALLEAMRSGSTDAEVESADLASPERPLRSALDRADACSRGMAHAVDKILLRLSGASVVTEEQPAEILPYKVVRGFIAQGSAVVSLTTPDGSLGLLVVGPGLVAYILDRRMGAPIPRGDDRVETRGELSPLDRRLLLPLVESLAATLGEQWCEDVDMFTAGEVFADAADIPMMAQFEPMLQLSLSVAPAGAAGDVVLFALSVGAVRASLPRAQKGAVKIADAERVKVLEALRESDLECVAMLGEVVSTVGQVIGLQAGDVLRLSGAPEVPVEVRVGDKVVLRGMPVVQHGNLAVQVSELE